MAANQRGFYVYFHRADCDFADCVGRVAAQVFPQTNRCGGGSFAFGIGGIYRVDYCGGGGREQRADCGKRRADFCGGDFAQWLGLFARLFGGARDGLAV